MDLSRRTDFFGRFSLLFEDGVFPSYQPTNKQANNLVVEVLVLFFSFFWFSSSSLIVLTSNQRFRGLTGKLDTSP